MSGDNNRWCYRVTTVESGKKMEKRIIVLCDLGVGGERGRVLDRKGIAGALSATEYKDAMKVVREFDDKRSIGVSNEILFVGNIRQKNQDFTGSVYSKNGLCPTIRARDYKEPVLVVKKWKRKQK